MTARSNSSNRSLFVAGSTAVMVTVAAGAYYYYYVYSKNIQKDGGEDEAEKGAKAAFSSEELQESSSPRSMATVEEEKKAEEIVAVTVGERPKDLTSEQEKTDEEDGNEDCSDTTVPAKARILFSGHWSKGGTSHTGNNVNGGDAPSVATTTDTSVWTEDDHEEIVSSLRASTPASTPPRKSSSAQPSWFNPISEELQEPPQHESEADIFMHRLLFG